MSAKGSRKRYIPVTPEEAKRLLDIIDKAIDEYEGSIDTLESAVGMFLVGRHVGWKPMALVHNKRTIRKYEEILGIDIRKDLPESTPLATRSLAYKAVEAIGNFWKAVSGDIKIDDRRELHKDV